MAKVIKDKPAKGNIEKELDLLQGKDKQKRKSEILRDSNIARTFTFKGVDFIVKDIKLDDHKLVIDVGASVNGSSLRVDNQLIFINPPIKVPDGTVHIEHVQSIDQDVEVANFVEDPQEALKTIIYEAIWRS